MPHLNQTVQEQNNRVRNNRKQHQDSMQAIMVQLLQKNIETNIENSTKPLISPVTRVLNLLEDVDLDNEQNRQSVIALKRNYSDNSISYLFATLILFLKNNLLSDSAFKFLKNSMNVIESVFKVISSLSGKGLMTAPNLDNFMSMPALKSLNVLFDIIGASDEENINQSGLDTIFSGVKSITEKVVSGITSSSGATTAAQALLLCAKSNIDSEVILQKVKSHPFPQRLAAAIIGSKAKGLELSKSMLDKLVASDNPAEILDSVLNKIRIEIAKDEDESLLAHAASFIDSESLLEQIKQSPISHKLAKAVVDLKAKGIEFSVAKLNQLVASNTPNDLIDSVFSGLSVDESQEQDQSLLGMATNYVTSAISSGASSMFSSAFNFFTKPPKNETSKTCCNEVKQATIQVPVVL